MAWGYGRDVGTLSSSSPDVCAGVLEVHCTHLPPRGHLCVHHTHTHTHTHTHIHTQGKSPHTVKANVLLLLLLLLLPLAVCALVPCPTSKAVAGAAA
jgi:hypothetical protein